MEQNNILNVDSSLEELTLVELTEVNGGGMNIWYVIGYVAGKVKEFITPADYKMSETMMNCM